METKKLNQILSKFSKCINKKNFNPVFACIKFDKGSLIVSDKENILVITVPELTHLSCFVDFDSVKKIINKIKVDSVELSQTDTLFIIKTLKGDFTLPLYFDLNSEFTSIPTIESELDLYITETHIELMKNALHFCGNDDLRPTFSGVHLDESGYITASDSNKLYYPTCQPTFGKSSIISQKAVLLLEKMLHLVEQNEEYISFTNEDYQIITRKIQGEVHLFKRIIPVNFNTTLTVSKKDIKESIELALLISNPFTNLCRFEITDKFILMSEYIEYNKTYKKTIDSKITGDSIIIGFDLKLLQQIFNVNYINDSEVGEEVDEFTFKINDPSGVVIINDIIAVMPKNFK